MQSYQPSIFRHPVLDPSFLESLQNGDELQAVTDDDQSLADWQKIWKWALKMANVSTQLLKFWNLLNSHQSCILCSMFIEAIQETMSSELNWSTNTSVVMVDPWIFLTNPSWNQSISSGHSKSKRPPCNLIKQNQSNKSNLVKIKSNQSKTKSYHIKKPIKETNKWKNEINWRMAWLVSTQSLVSNKLVFWSDCFTNWGSLKIFCPKRPSSKSSVISCCRTTLCDRQPLTPPSVEMSWTGVKSKPVLITAE